MLHSQLSGNGTRPSAQVQRRPSARQPPHFQFFPGHTLLDPRAQRLRPCLLGRKTGREALCKRRFHAAIRNLFVRENTMQEPLAVPLDRPRNPWHFDQIDSRSHQHDATVAHAKIFSDRFPAVAVIGFSPFSDAASVHDLCEPDRVTKGWDLNLTALCADEAPRTIRFLTGALMACGGYVLSRRFDPTGTAAIEFEFVRATCVEMYSVMIAAGLELSAESHFAMGTLCQCTRETLESTAGDAVRVDLTIRKASTPPGRAPDGSASPR